MSQNRLPHIIITGEGGHGKDTIGDHLVDRYNYVRLSFSDGIRDEVVQAYAQACEPVSNDWLNLRAIKEQPQQRLALKYCTDERFVRIAMDAFEAEDQERFNSLKSTLATSGFGSCAELPFPGLFQSTGFQPQERLALARSPRRIQQIWGTDHRRTQDPDYWVKYADAVADLSKPQVMTSGRFPNELAYTYSIGGVRIHVERPGQKGVAAHVSEQQSLPFDEHTIVLINDSTVESLWDKVDTILDHLAQKAPFKKTSRMAF